MTPRPLRTGLSLGLGRYSGLKDADLKNTRQLGILHSVSGNVLAVASLPGMNARSAQLCDQIRFVSESRHVKSLSWIFTGLAVSSQGHER